MIYAVTLNPCLDKTLTVPAWKSGDTVRGLEARRVVGGKGNNVARALMRLGREVRPVTFFGGATGTFCSCLLQTQDGFTDRLTPMVTETKAETRVILTVRTEGTGDQTAFFDPDPAIAPNEAKLFFRRLETAMKESDIDVLTLSGSSPSESTHGLYAALISLANEHGVPVFLDTYGPALARIEAHWPTAIQLNLREAGVYLGKSQPNEADCLGLLDRWIAQGVEIATVTHGPDPAFVAIRGAKYRVQPPRIEPVNPIGSGDSMLAGFVDGRLSGLDAEALIRRAFGSAISNAMVWDAGAVDPAEVIRQGNLVRIESLGAVSDS